MMYKDLKNAEFREKINFVRKNMGHEINQLINSVLGPWTWRLE